jgi:O-antigen/teichoic acid export membrane protein
MVLTIFLLTPELVRALLTDKWLPMVPLLQGLLIYSYLRSLHDDTGGFLTSIGRPKLMTRFLVVEALVLLIASPILVTKLGASGAVWAIDIAIAIGTIMSYTTINRIIKVDFRHAILAPIVAGVMAATVYFFAKGLLDGLALSPIPSLIIRGLLINILYGLGVLLIQRKYLIESIKYVKYIMTKEEINETPIQTVVN